MACAGGRGCGDVYLTGSALELLELFRTRPFLPLGLRGEKPLYIDDSGAERVNSVLALSLNGLVTLDYGVPLEGFDYSDYVNCSGLGSMALTLRGQQALDAVDIEGVG